MQKFSITDYISKIEDEALDIQAEDRFVILQDCNIIKTTVLESWGDVLILAVDSTNDWVLENSGLELAPSDDLLEAVYQGRTVSLNKPMKGDVKKSKVYVKKPNGKIVKVNFGDKKLKIKKHIPGRRKNFRARHNCDNPGPKWKARYWSCRAW
jgi:hypothetical protein